MRSRSIPLHYTFMDLRDFSHKTDSTCRNRQNVYLENQMKSNLFRSNLFKRKGEVHVLFFIPLYVFSWCFKSHEISLQGNLAKEYFLPFGKKRKGNYVCKKNKTGNCMISLHVTNVYNEAKNKTVILHSFAKKTNVSYYIIFFKTLLRTFSCDLCYFDRRIISSYCEKRKVNYYIWKKNKRANTL